MSPADDISHLSLIEVRERLARNERVLNSGLFAGSAGLAGAAPRPGASTSPFEYSPGARQGGPNGSSGLQLPSAFSPSPTQSPGASGTLSSNTTWGTGPGAQPIPGPSRPSFSLPGPSVPAPGTSPTDNVRARLLSVRQALLEREQQLVVQQTTEGLGELELDVNSGVGLSEGSGLGHAARRRSSAASAGVGVKPGLMTSGKQAVLQRARERDKLLPPGSMML